MKLDDTYLPLGAIAPPSSPQRIQYGAFQPRSWVAGPGTRAVVWVSGCLRRCPGCMKPDLFDFAAGVSATVDELARRILAVSGLDGVTFSGGEPFEQAAALASLAGILHEAGLSVLVYSGYRLEALRASERFQPLLAETDLLIDGEYRHDLSGPLRWRGSPNQTLHVLSPRGNALPLSSEPVRELQASFTPEALRLSGFPSPEIEEELRLRLASRGILMRPADLGDVDL